MDAQDGQSAILQSRWGTEGLEKIATLVHYGSILSATEAHVCVTVLVRRRCVMRTLLKHVPVRNDSFRNPCQVLHEWRPSQAA